MPQRDTQQRSRWWPAYANEGVPSWYRHQQFARLATQLPCKGSKMVEIARLEEAGGGTLKYYKSNTRVFSYDLPADSEETLAPAQETATEGLESLVETLYAEHGGEIEAVAREMKPCEYCETQHYEEFVLRELVNRALIDLSETGTLDAVFAESD